MTDMTKLTAKRIAAAVLAMMLCGSMLTACGSDDSSSSSAPSATTVEQSTPESSTPEETSAPESSEPESSEPESSAPDTTEAKVEQVDITDPDKLFWGNIEGKGTFRIELYNDYGWESKTKNGECAFDRESFEFDGGIAVTFDISGITDQSKEYDAFLMFASNDWSWGVWDLAGAGAGATKIKGDGTYTVFVDNALPFGKEGEIGANGPFGETGSLISVWAPVVFCIDVAELAADENIDPENPCENNIQISNLKIEYWNDGSRPAEIQARLDGEAPAEGGDDTAAESESAAE